MPAKTKRPGTTTRARAQESGLEGSRAKAPSAEPQIQAEPKPPFAKQKQSGVGLESKLDPKPRYEAPRYRPAGSSKASARSSPAETPASAAPSR